MRLREDDELISSALNTQRPLAKQRDPAANDAVADPQTKEGDQYPGDGDADDGNDQRAINHQPEQREPEGADLPAEVTFQPGAIDIATLQVIEQDGTKRGQAKDETTGNGRRRGNADENGDGVQAIDEMRQMDQ